jgi:ParB-like chromosome segregation protein Spo0J
MTLIRHGMQTLKIAKLKLPGDIATRRRSPKVVTLGNSFQATGGQPMNPPVVEKGTWKLIAGGDRISGCMNEGLTEVDCLVVSGSEDELRETMLIENAMRRHSSSEQDVALHELVKLHQAREQEEEFPEVTKELEVELDEEEPEPPKKTHPHKVKARAIEAVAQMTGKSHSAVKNATMRARKKEAEKRETAPVAVEEPPVLVIESMGLDVPDAIAKQTALEHAGLQAIHRELVTLQAKLTRFEGEVGHQFQSLKASLHDAAVNANNALPESVCPWCKLTVRQVGCPGCSGKGWLTAGEMKAVRDEHLMVTGPAAGIYVDGKFQKLAEVS